MNYQNIWKKLLNTNEQLQYEFSVSGVFRSLSLAFWLALSLFIGVIGLLVFSLTIEIAVGAVIVLSFFGWFYFIFYLPRANAYCLTDKRVIIHRGWLSSAAISMFYGRITDITVMQTVWQKLITNDGTVMVNSAGAAGHEIVLYNIHNPYNIKQRIGNLTETAKTQNNFKTAT